MPPIIIQTLRSRGFSIGVHVFLWVLLYLAVTHLGGKTPPFVDAGTASSPQTLAPVVKLENVFSGAEFSKPATNTLVPTPFFTRHFVPPPTPAPAPPPTTRKIDITYQGFYQTTQGPRVAVLKIADSLMTARIGALVATNVYVASANSTNVVLTNTTGVTNILLLNTMKEIEVPIR